jgi:hypothetical protein
VRFFGIADSAVTVRQTSHLDTLIAASAVGGLAPPGEAEFAVEVVHGHNSFATWEISWMESSGGSAAVVMRWKRSTCCPISSVLSR